MHLPWMQLEVWWRALVLQEAPETGGQAMSGLGDWGFAIAVFALFVALKCSSAIAGLRLTREDHERRIGRLEDRP